MLTNIIPTVNSHISNEFHIELTLGLQVLHCISNEVHSVHCQLTPIILIETIESHVVSLSKMMPCWDISLLAWIHAIEAEIDVYLQICLLNATLCQCSVSVVCNMAMCDRFHKFSTKITDNNLSNKAKSQLNVFCCFICDCLNVGYARKSDNQIEY